MRVLVLFCKVFSPFSWLLLILLKTLTFQPHSYTHIHLLSHIYHIIFYAQNIDIKENQTHCAKQFIMVNRFELISSIARPCNDINRLVKFCQRSFTNWYSMYCTCLYSHMIKLLLFANVIGILKFIFLIKLFFAEFVINILNNFDNL